MNVQAAAKIAQQLERYRDQWPLAMWAPWCREPRPDDPHDEWDNYSSQRQVLTGLLAPDLFVGLVFGGNGSGKTVTGFAADMALTLGSAHPTVQMWARNAGISLDGLPRTAGRCVIVAKSSNDSIRYHRPRIAALLPRQRANKWYNLNGKGEAHVCVGDSAESANGALVTLPNGAEFWFKSQDQGWESFQGDEWRVVHLDEELLVDDGEAIFDELLMRAARAAGRIIYTMTALSGETWTYRRLVKAPVPRSRVWWMDSYENPHLPLDTMRIAFAGMSQAQIARRRYGKFVALEGRIYPALELSPDNVGDGTGAEHLLRESWLPPTAWPRVLGLDFGWTDPSVCLWGAVDSEARIYWYRVLYITQTTADAFANMVAWLSGFNVDPVRIPSRRGRPSVYGADRPAEPEPIEAAWGDPSHPTYIRSLVSRDIPVRRANKNWEDGVARVRMRTVRQGDGRPRLYLRADLMPVIDEHRAYVHAVAPSGAKETPAAGSDHTCDAGRYMIVGVDRMQRIL